MRKVSQSSTDGLEFTQAGWKRRIQTGPPAHGSAGIVELMDNNPLVCADEATLPGPASSLACLALGPLLRAGILLDDPALAVSPEHDEDQIEAWLRHLGWTGTCSLSKLNGELAGASALTAFAEVSTPSSPQDLDDLFEEAYGRSFFVRKDDHSEWDVKLVVGSQFCVYRFKLSPGDSTSIVTLQAMADRKGKCGAGQIVHCMNVMAGYEESLGLTQA